MDQVFLQGFLLFQQNFFNLIEASPFIVAFFGLLWLLSLFTRK